MKLIAKNKKAFFEYEILDKIEAGIVLTGDEVKSLRAGHVAMTGSYAAFKQGELYMINCNISPYEKAFAQPKEKDYATRSRKLLLKRRELNKLFGRVSQKGVTIVPLSMYFNDRNMVKVELGIGKAKKAAGKKQAIKERDLDKQAKRELKDVYKYK